MGASTRSECRLLEFIIGHWPLVIYCSFSLQVACCKAEKTLMTAKDIDRGGGPFVDLLSLDCQHMSESSCRSASMSRRRWSMRDIVASGNLVHT